MKMLSRTIIFSFVFIALLSFVVVVRCQDETKDGISSTSDRRMRSTRRLRALLGVPPPLTLFQKFGSRYGGSLKEHGGVPPYKELWYKQVLDHFDFTPTNPQTFQQRYLICDKFWDQNPNSPIFFYAGNEGFIEIFYENTGFMFDIAPKYNALIVFVEHRYYGKTLPFGDQSFTNQNIRYLSSAQALADYSKFLIDFKKQWDIQQDAPVICFGGSYGGMLSSWMKMKYPHAIKGAIASSAPIYYFQDLVSPYAFSEIITKDYNDVHPQCGQNIKDAFLMVQKLGNEQQYEELRKRFRLCDPVTSQKDVMQLIQFIETALTYVPMLDYPYATDFLQPLPAWPVNVTCSKMLQSLEFGSLDLLNSLANAAGVYYNTSGTLTCFNTSSPDAPTLGMESWLYQTCTEMVMPFGNNGKTDIFLPSEWNYSAFAKECKDQFNVTPRPDWPVVFYGYGSSQLKSARNIVFTNGYLDPWRSGGVPVYDDNSVLSIYIPQSAHHLDLRSSNPNDPVSVIQARKVMMEHIDRWIQE